MEDNEQNPQYTFQTINKRERSEEDMDSSREKVHVIQMKADQHQEHYKIILKYLANLDKIYEQNFIRQSF